MGKQKRVRQKAHSPAVKPKQKISESDKVEVVDMMETNEQVPSMSNFMDDTQNIFKSVKIDNKDLQQILPDFDARSCITSKSLKDLKLKKKDKQKLRHELWIKKLSAIDTAKKNAREKKKRQQTPVVGDIGMLGEALPTLDLLLKGDNSKKRNQTDEKPRSVPKEKKRKAQMLNDIALFQQVRKHPAFKENPRQTIHEHLQNKLKQEDMDT